MKAEIVVVGFLLAAAAGGQARAGDSDASYEVEGEADAGAADARVAALDDAFGRAAKRAVDDMVPGAVRTAKKQDLDREILGHARLWVASFSVTKDTTDDDRRQLTVSVRVDRDKMRARLAELGITADAAPAQPTGGQPAEPASKARSVAVLLRVAAPEAVHATYGAKAERDKDVPGATAIAGALRTAGYAVKRAAAAEPASSGPELSDGDAQALAAAAKADFALAATVIVDPPAAVRGVAGEAVLATARLKLVDAASGKSVGDGAASVAVGGSEAPAVAVDRCVRAALGDVVPAPARAIAAGPVPGGYHGDDTPVAEPGVVLVRLPAKTPWASVLAEQKFLVHGKGVTRAALHRLSPGGWIIGVTTGLSVEQVGSLAKKPPAADTTASARVANGIVEVTLTVTQPAGATPP